MIYPPAAKDMSLTLSSYPKIIRPYRKHLSTMLVQLYPNDSTTMYDKHQFDAPIGLETDITFVFYNNVDNF